MPAAISTHSIQRATESIMIELRPMVITNLVTSFARTMPVAFQLTRQYKNPTSLLQPVARPGVALLSLLV